MFFSLMTVEDTETRSGEVSNISLMTGRRLWARGLCKDIPNLKIKVIYFYLEDMLPLSPPQKFSGGD